MIARLPYNPRVLASPDDLRVEPEIAQLLRDSKFPGAWCIALDGVGRDAAPLLRQSVVRLGGIPWGWAGDDISDILLCLPANRVEKALRELARHGRAVAGVREALAGVVEAWQRERWALRCGDTELAVGARTLVMGIVNVTPDSFSDGGQFDDTKAAVEHGLRLAEEGADILDIGGESTRPGAAAVDAEGECERVLPVVERLAREVQVPVSIDTSKASVAQRALDAGATIVNDVTALRGDPEMAGVAARARVPVALMHMKGTPRTMQKSPQYGDLMGEIIGKLRGSMALAVDAGVDESQILVDPGIGFGKTVEHNLAILRLLPQLRSLGRPILLGTSRKSFIGAVTGAEVTERVFGTAATVAYGIAQGAHIVRVHDVAEMGQVVRMADAMIGRG